MRAFPQGARKQATRVGRRMWMHGVVAVCVCFLASSGAQAASITFASSVYFGAASVPPDGSPPWVTATFDDGGSAGTVDLTLETTNLTALEFVGSWLFNFDPDLDLGELAVSEDPILKIGEFTNPTITIMEDGFRADGDGFFDIKFDFDQTDAAEYKFGRGEVEVVAYTFTSSEEITAYSFDFLCEEGGGEYPTAAHVQDIGGHEVASAWVSVPEPATLSILGVGSLALLRRRRK